MNPVKEFATVDQPTQNHRHTRLKPDTLQSSKNMTETNHVTGTEGHQYGKVQWSVTH